MRQDPKKLVFLDFNTCKKVDHPTLLKNYQKGHSIVALSAPKQSLPAAKNNISFLKVSLSLFSEHLMFTLYLTEISKYYLLRSKYCLL